MGCGASTLQNKLAIRSIGFNKYGFKFQFKKLNNIQFINEYFFKIH